MEIIEIALKTHCLAELRSFYVQTLAMTLLDESDDHIALSAGQTRLIFERDERQVYQYHFAFNIPAAQIQDAHDWLQGRAPILPGADGPIITSSPGWQAQMVYFPDPAGNIVEFIARKRLPDSAGIPFSAQSILNVSEIGLALDDVQAFAADISTRIPYFEPGSDTFQPMGDDNGLLILAKVGRGWYPTGEVKAQPLPVDLVIRGAPDKPPYDVPGYPYRLRTAAPST